MKLSVPNLIFLHFLLLELLKYISIVLYDIV